MLPRALSKQSRTTASAPKPASEPEPVASTSKLDEEASSLTIAPGTDLSLDNEANLIFDIETVLSDFGLYRDPELLSRVKSSQDGGLSPSPV